MIGASAPFAAFALCFAGMAALSLAMDRHCEHIGSGGDASPRRRTAARAAGALLLALALWRCTVVFGPSVGLVAWCGGLAAGALLVAVLLTWRPHFTAHAGFTALALAALTLLIS